MATLGILITSEHHIAFASEIAQAAYGKGHTVRVHLTGPGVTICNNTIFSTLATWAEVTICRHSAEQLGLAADLDKRCPHRLASEKQIADIIVECDRHLVL